MIQYGWVKKMNDLNYYKTNVKRPNPWIYYPFLFITSPYFFLRGNVKVDKSQIKHLKKPFILIFNHPSKLDSCYVYFPLWRHRINTMIAYYYFCNYRIAEFFHQLGGYPKTLFAPDLAAIKNTIKIIKEQGAIGISPEGRLSPHGALESVHPSTVKLFKRLQVDVIMGHINGAYFAYPKWSKRIRRGRIEVSYEHLFTPEELNLSTEDVLLKKLEQAMHYDDYQWQAKKHIYYHGRKFAEGLEHILYICPQCKSRYTTQTKNDHITCSHCGYDMKLTHYYDFEGAGCIYTTIRDWYLFQKEYEKQTLLPNSKLESHVTLKMPDPKGKGFKIVGEGDVVFDESKLVYTGCVNGEKKTIEYKIENIQAIVFGVNEDFEIYQDNTLYYFIPDNIRECVRYAIVSEIFYERFMKNKNRK